MHGATIKTTIINLQCLLVSTFRTGHLQNMHHLELKKNSTDVLMLNGKRSSYL